ncbi:MAG TPA: SDR family oxidoreductase [Xanthobacteraceae bacterium]|nr:SDR family oxidoreductase [Xanthobacteraceae bacterium]
MSPADATVTTARRPVAVITGASSGIGAELAREFAAHGHELVLVARREHELALLADDIAARGGPRPTVLPLDLAMPDISATLARELEARGLQPQYVVNNAGFGLAGHAARLSRAEQLTMIDLNVRALVDLSLAFVEDLAAQTGGLLNVASVAGFLPGPGAAVYYASKAFVLSFTEALHWELAQRGIRVTVLCPGPVPTGFQRRAGVERELKLSPMTRSAGEVARAGYRGLMEGRRRVVPGWPNRLVTALVGFAPRDLVLKLVEARQNRRRSAL